MESSNSDILSEIRRRVQEVFNGSEVFVNNEENLENLKGVIIKYFKDLEDESDPWHFNSEDILLEVGANPDEIKIIIPDRFGYLFDDIEHWRK